MNRNEKIEKLITVARAQIGKPYQYGAYLNSEKNPAKGFDCSSFTQYVFGKVGIKIRRASVDQAAETKGEKIIDLGKAESGDLIFFLGNRGHYYYDESKKDWILVGHVGIYTGDGNIIHAADNLIVKGVIEHSLSLLPDPPYKIVMIKRLL